MNNKKDVIFFPSDYFYYSILIPQIFWVLKTIHLPKSGLHDLPHNILGRNIIKNLNNNIVLVIIIKRLFIYPLVGKC